MGRHIFEGTRFCAAPGWRELRPGLMPVSQARRRRRRSAGYGFRMAIVCQDVAQLDGKSTRVTTISDSQIKLLIQINDLETSEFVSKDARRDDTGLQNAGDAAGARPLRAAPLDAALCAPPVAQSARTARNVRAAQVRARSALQGPISRRGKWSGPATCSPFGRARCCIPSRISVRRH